MTGRFITEQTAISNEALNVIAHLPTKSLPSLVANRFFEKLIDADFMRIAALLGQKGYGDRGCPIGGVIISNDTRQILEKVTIH